MENKLLPCPMRHEDGNCLRIGGDCSSVPRDVCAAVKNAYENGVAEGIRRASPANPPLTLEQLREMDGEPVWTFTIGCDTIYGCELVGEFANGPDGRETIRMCNMLDGPYDVFTDLYGKTWLAYAHRKDE